MLPSFYIPELFDLQVGDSDDTQSTIELYGAAVSGKHRAIVDIGAGTGRIAIPLAKQGHQLTCVEADRGMFNRLNENAKLARVQIRALNTLFGKKPMEQLLHDAAIAVDDFLIGLKDDQDLRRFFHDVRSWLNPGGAILADVRHRSQKKMEANSGLVKAFPMVDTEETGFGDWLSLTSWENYDALSRKLITICRYEFLTHDGEVKTVFFRELKQRVFLNREILAAAESQGFDLVSYQPRHGTRTESEIGGFFEFCKGK